ncbi:unnamed protein product [Plasmodium vivax]|uniref:(malaria parasite P. vivax) hypothetical protein n=1 Tax=Plasmodium vivax TaxID=5855 RepID=A0A8S4HM22_PLAVI|nr:unnamed protein product [Plasmodium vivax]
MSNVTDYSLDIIQDQYSFIQKSKFYNIYKEFDKPCKNYHVDKEASCPKTTLGDSSTPANVTDLLEKLYSNFYRVNVAYKPINNDYFGENLYEVEKIGCICLKYWLYDQIITKGLQESEIKELFNGYKNYIYGKITDIPQYYCNNNELSLNNIKNIKKIYALNTFLHTYVTNFNNCNSNSCKYMEYFGEGLDEFINSIKKCSSDSSNNEYCNEFNEFLELCKKNNEYAGISIYDENTKREAETARKYFLFSEKYKNEQLYIYINDTELLNFVKTSDFLSNKNRTTIAATSIVGSAIGLSSFFYYFYKFTPFGRSLRKGKAKNIVNIDEGAHDSLLYTSNSEQAAFKNRKYNVAYHNFSDD